MKTRTSCRVCEGSLDAILSLGEHYVSDFIMPGEKDGVKAPLELVLCRRCRLLQLKHTVPAETMYRNYWYRSGTNKTMKDALADIANKTELLIHLRPGDAVLDIGCNDGTLLDSYKAGGIYKIGFDPAENMEQYSKKVADKIVVDFFNMETFSRDHELNNKKPKIVTSIAMFYDLEDPKKFVADIKAIMHPDGVWVVQMSYLPSMLSQNEFGNICHEHLEYYSLHSLEYLLELCDFEIVDAELNNINGGSIRAYVRNCSADKSVFGDQIYRELAAERVNALREQENKIGLHEASAYYEFALWVERIKQDIVNFIREQASKGKKIYVYGASTKGNTILQYFGIDSTLITAAVERNPEKWGKVTVGTHIPIISEEQARMEKPDYYLVLPWHFLEEFKRREMDFLRAGGRFIMPAPYFTLI